MAKFEYKELAHRVGSKESTVVTLVTDMEKGTSEIKIEKQIREYYPTKDLKKVMQLFEDLGAGNGRVIPKLKDLT